MQSIKNHRLVYAGLIIGMLIIMVDGVHGPLPAIVLEIGMLANLSDFDLYTSMAAIGMVISLLIIVIVGGMNLVSLFNRIILMVALLYYNALLIIFGIMESTTIFWISASLFLFFSVLALLKIISITLYKSSSK